MLLPHLRIDYVRELKDDVDVFGVRFAADPNAASTPPILVLRKYSILNSEGSSCRGYRMIRLY